MKSQKVFKKIKILIPFFCLILNFIRAQDCSTPTPSVFLLDTIPVQNRASSFPNATLKVAIHIIRKDNGSGDNLITPSQAVSAFDIMSSHFTPLGVCFQLKSLTFLDETDFYNYNETKDDFSDFWALVNTDINADAIDIYMLPIIQIGTGASSSIAVFAHTAGIPGRAIVVGRKILSDGATLTHEMGHALGLLHTFETAFGTELPDESNCATAGDQVCDTPADPKNGFDKINCIFTGGGGFNPLTNNYMMEPDQSTCRSAFTNGQVQRMLTIIPNAPELVARIVQNNATLSGIAYPTNPNILTTKIAAKNNIYVNDVTIASSASVGLIAENQIKIDKEFIASSGSYFEAKIGSSCPASFDFRKNGGSNDPSKNHNQNQNPDMNNLLSDKGDSKSLLEREGINIKVIPNPGIGVYKIKKDLREATVEIYNLQGALIKKEVLTEKETQIDISEYSSGIYTFLFKVNDGSNKAIKVVKD